MLLDIALRGSPYAKRIEVLDDTGSSYVELFDDDCTDLGLDSLNPPPPVQFSTAGPRSQLQLGMSYGFSSR